jgi:hypothetical protein
MSTSLLVRSLPGGEAVLHEEKSIGMKKITSGLWWKK